ncbi:MAG: hypothetical protein ABI852_22150 [Gemmatimonadaceae bacterium]
MMPINSTFRLSRLRSLISLSAAAVTASTPIFAIAQSAKWTVDARPSFVLGRTGDGTTAEFAFVNGATMLPGGNVMVSDRSEYSMLIVAPTGKVVKKFGRSGQGPGELTNAFFSYSCGKNVFIGNNAGRSISVFALDGSFVRTSMFGVHFSKQGPYRTACNRNGVFVHYGWDNGKDRTPGVSYRSQVPVWATPGDSSKGTLIATVKGSERWEYTIQPLGRETRIAIGSDRVYVGEADGYEIKVLSLDGKPLPAVRKDAKPIAVTKQDIQEDADRLIAMMGEKYRKMVEKENASTPMPKTLPPYRELTVDNDDNLWVRDYARTGPDNVTWTVFSKNGNLLSEVLLPNALEVYEIGQDYILGRYIDENVGAPEVRSYRLIKQ